MQSLVIVAHGSHLNPGSSAPTYDHADTIRATGAFDEVKTGFWKEEPHFREVLRTVEGDEIYVVPLFISEGYFTEQVIPRELRLDGWDVSEWNSDGLSADQATLIAEDIDREVHYCGPVGTHRAMTDVIVRRAESVTGNSDVGGVRARRRRPRYRAQRELGESGPVPRRPDRRARPLRRGEGALHGRRSRGRRPPRVSRATTWFWSRSLSPTATTPKRTSRRTWDSVRTIQRGTMCPLRSTAPGSGTRARSAPNP